MVINRKDIKRKRKTNNVASNLLDDTPKRTKVQAQRKFAQGSNVSSPVITPVKEIEKQDRTRVDVLPEPQELLPMNRPHTEDFLTFLCFRGTAMLPPSLNFFNAAPVNSHVHIQPLQKEPITVIPPIANIGTRSSSGTGERPFIAFGVRKRADPILVSRHMDKKRRHALALQALRRKYQEQKMAKIRAVTISKLSEKVTSKSVVRTRSISKNENDTVKKSLPQKTKVKIISTKHVKVTTRSAIKTPLRTQFTTPIRSTIQKRMCLRSFRGRFIQRELTIKKSKKKNTTKIIKKVQTKQTREISSEFSSDDDQPLKSFKMCKPNKVVTKKRIVSTKKTPDLSFRVTRAHPVLLKSGEQGFKRKIHMVRSTMNAKLPYVKLTAPKILTTKQKQVEEKLAIMEKLRNKEKVLNLRTRKGNEVIRMIDEKKKTGNCVGRKKVKKFIKNPEVVPERVTRNSAAAAPAKNLPKKPVSVSNEVKKLESLKAIGRTEEKAHDDKKVEPDTCKLNTQSVSCANNKHSKEDQKPKEKPAKLREKAEIESIKLPDQFRVILKKDLQTVMGIESKVGKTKVETEEATVNVRCEMSSEAEKSKNGQISKSDSIQKNEDIKKLEVVGDSIRPKSKFETLPHKKTKKEDAVNDVKKTETTIRDKIEIIELLDVPDLKKTINEEVTCNVKSELDKFNNIRDTHGGVENKLEKTDAKSMKRRPQHFEDPHLFQDSSILNNLKEDRNKLEKLETSVRKKRSENFGELHLSESNSLDDLKDGKNNPVKKRPNDFEEPHLYQTGMILDTPKDGRNQLEEVEAKSTTKKLQNFEELHLCQTNCILDSLKDGKNQLDKVEVKCTKKKLQNLEECQPNIILDTLKDSKNKVENVEAKSTKKKSQMFEEPSNFILDTSKDCKNTLEKVETKPSKNRLPNFEESHLSQSNIILDTPKDGKKKLEKTEVKLAKKKARNFEEPRLSQRPTRKTKEAAAIYMEILGHKLVNDDGMDDDISIDSFPELPNVRKTEQRENELKAIAKSKTVDISEVEVTKEEENDKKLEDLDNDTDVQKMYSLDTSHAAKRTTRRSMQPKSTTNCGDLILRQKIPQPAKCKKTEPSKTKMPITNDSDSEESTTSKLMEKKKFHQNDASIFSDSDEEPLSKLTTMKRQVSDVAKEVDSPMLTLGGKPKRECTKRPQNYVPLFSSSEDEDRYFDRFTKMEAVKNKKVQSKCVPTASADLLCKDVDKRFGKGKVNMSTEQIEQWLKDSALAGGVKKDDLYKFDEKFEANDNASKDKVKLSKIVDLPLKGKDEDTPQTTDKSSKLDYEGTRANQRMLERKTIFRKEQKIPVPKVNAFSANNESSVYAFEADSEDIVSTPFRRPSRRPSSTGTSRSEDSSKIDDSSKSKFRYPPVFKQDTAKAANKQEVSLTLSTSESNSASIAVQLDINTTEVVVNTENPSDREDGEQLFYIPLQPGKQSSSQVIQGVAVKLGTKGASGPNQQVVMSAKLVTHNPMEGQKLTEKPLANMSSMYPPASITQKPKIMEGRSYLKSGVGNKSSDYSDDFKYKIPSSPSASSSSSTKITKRQCVKTRIRPLELCNPIISKEFPKGDRLPVVVEAPTFYPNEREFQDPLEYIQKIRLHAEQFGICRIVPPSNFKPECKVADDMRFTAYNQYVHKMLHRWGPNFKEFMAISKYLETQNITLTHPPWIGGMEIDLPRLYQIVQNLGGLKEVIEKKKWPKVSELMKIPKSAQDRVTKLDDIYCKYLLPYDTLSVAEREKLFDEVETEWAKRESKTLLKSQQNVTNRDSSPTCSDVDSNDESDECIVKGRSMALNAFYRIARNTMSMWFKTMDPLAHEVEQEFWKHVTLKQNHICVHSGSIDSGNWGYGFAVSKNSPFARHAWNLKVLTNNSASVLRSMGPVMGVTVPTLHVGMVFSACCWYRDPHSLPWIEYLHTGGNKIWYGIPDSMSELFRSALLKLVPNYCRNKSLWLPSDTAMVPPSLLVENGVSLCRITQEPGQFIVVFPKAFTSSLCTGYVVSESVYFAPSHWLSRAKAVFKELQNNCEPSMFSLEKLIISIANDSRSTIEVLKIIVPIVQTLCDKEKSHIEKLTQFGLTDKERFPLPDQSLKKKKHMHSDGGDYECDACCTNLFISWIIYSQEDAVYCLDHAIENIEKNQVNASNCKLVYTYNASDLLKLIEKVNNLIETKSQKKVAAKGL